jgi:hypothetical protein
MNADTYTRVVLTVIAVALVIIALRGVSPIPVAHAAETMDCRFDGPLQIRDEIKVKLDSYGLPGSSSSSPMYVKTVQ